MTRTATLLLSTIFLAAPPLAAPTLAAPTLAAPALAAAPPLTASAVAVADRYSADTAAAIFHEGGNAVDAAVAIAFTLAVTYPEAGNLGGGGFMTLYVHGKPYFLDYRECAPLAATPGMYLDAQGNVVKGMSTIGFKAVGVPGTVAGMGAAEKRFGRLKWSQVLAPAIRLAQNGFTVDPELAERYRHAAEDLAPATNLATFFAGLTPGATFRQPLLAATLERLAKDGPGEFYTGQTARDLAAFMRQGGGLIGMKDLADYKAVWRAPVTAEWDGFSVITAPPPSSGGVGLIQLLKMKADLKQAFAGVALNSPKYINLTAEIEKRVFADRAQYLGDPDFYKVPVSRLIDSAYLAQRAAQVNPNGPSDTKSVLPGLGTAMPERAETTHFSVIDKWGNAVANTFTINGYFGSGEVVPQDGFLLNDEMDDFSSKPGVANQFGVVGSDANAIEPRKRPLSSMDPTVLTRNGAVALAIGTPGGSRIFTSIYQVLVDLYDFHMPLKEAVAAMRFHHQLLPPNTIFYEPYAPITGDLAKQLEAMGYVLKGQSFNGDIEAVKINGTTPLPVADPRGRGVTRVIP